MGEIVDAVLAQPTLHRPHIQPQATLRPRLGAPICSPRARNSQVRATGQPKILDCEPSQVKGVDRRLGVEPGSGQRRPDDVAEGREACFIRPDVYDGEAIVGAITDVVEALGLGVYSGPAGQGTAEDAMESLALVWPGYFANSGDAPPMPPLRISGDCYAATFLSIARHFEDKTLEHRQASLTMPSVLLLGAGSPIPPAYGIATAALIPGARYRIEPGCGHFPWLERPGSVRAALDSICS